MSTVTFAVWRRAEVRRRTAGLDPRSAHVVARYLQGHDRSLFWSDYHHSGALTPSPSPRKAT